MNKVQLPFGMQDYLPEECYNKEKSENKMSEVFSSYGYKRVSMPTLEYYDLFTADGAMQGNKLFKLTDTDGSLLALRADATIQVCRMYVTSMSGVQRMFYSLDSFEYLSDVNSARDREFAQMGVELLGNSGIDGEVELLAMAVDALTSAGLKKFTIELGHVGYFEGLAEEFGLSSENVGKLKALINKKDMLGVELFFNELGISEKHKESILSLPLLFGTPSILDKADALCHNEKSHAAIARLKMLTDKLDKMGIGKYFSIDLGLVSSNNYYTGVVFKGICEGVGASILDGGRYDGLCDRMGKPTEAVGFAVGVKRLLTALKQAGVWEKAPKADVAFAIIDCDESLVRSTVSKLRKKNRVVQVFGNENDLIAYCNERGISRAILFDGDAVELTLSAKGGKI